MTPSHEELSVRAYLLWEQRGCPIGSPDVDWQRAEEELSAAEAPPAAPDGAEGRARRRGAGRKDQAR